MKNTILFFLFTAIATYTLSAGDIHKVPKNRFISKTDPAQKYLPEVYKSIPQSHPRLFYSKALFEEFRRKAESPELKPRLEFLQQRTLRSYKELISYTKENDGLQEKLPPGTSSWHPIGNFGIIAGRAAFFYHLTGEKKWALLSIDLMKRYSGYYRKRIAKGRAVNWYGWGRVMHIMAWDYLYDVMSKEDRDSIAKEILAHAKWLSHRKNVSKLLNAGEGVNSSGSGFYSAHCMVPWYAGVVFHKAGYDDAFAEQCLAKGLSGHLAMLKFRNSMAGDDGGSANSVPAYCYGTYNHVEFWFFFSYRTLTGRNIARDFPQMGLFPFWLTYTIFTGIDGKPYEFGTGSGWHIDNHFLPQSPYHALFRNFYDGKTCDLSDRLHAMIPWNKGSWTPLHYLSYTSGAFHPFYMFFDKSNLENKTLPSAFFRQLPKGYYFERLGQLYMHSSWDKEATRALFTCGGKSASHKEADENNFIIYKGGFLALDSGTRSLDNTPEGLKRYLAHDNNYRAQSIAHNVILIHMEGEKFPTWRFDPKKVLNHGGMNRTLGGVMRAFETNEHFTYAAGDATKCYHKDKAERVVRQFLMIYPDLFVIYDRVRSVKAHQQKTFLLHTSEEPLVKGNTFEAVQKEGRLICRTLLPEKAVLRKVGGPGKEFTVNGINFSPSMRGLDSMVKQARKAGRDAPMWGGYRMEITDPVPKKDQTFLHVIQVGLKKDLKKMIPLQLLRQGKYEGVSFTYNNTAYTLLFDPEKVPSGHIKAIRKNRVLYDRPFTEGVQPQKAVDFLK